MKQVLLAMVVTLLLMVCCSGVVSAGGTITIDIPEVAADVDQVSTIPVTIHNAADILGFKMYVYNNISNVAVTVNSSQPLDSVAGSSYDVNSGTSRDYQVVSWATSELHGITGDAVLFYIDVLPSKNAPSELPITVGVLDEMFDASFVEVHADYPVPPVVLQISGASGVLVEKTPSAVPSATETPEEAGTPVQTSGVSPSPSVSAAETMPSALPLSTTNKEPVAPTASPMPVFGILAGLGVLVLLRK